MQNIGKKDIFVFVIGLLAMVKVRILGTFAIAEIMAFIATPFIASSLYKNNKNARRLLKYGILWLVGVLIADFVNETPIQDALKGIFNVIFLLMLIPFVYWSLYDKPQRFMFYYAGFAISSLYNYYNQKIPTLETEFEREVWFVYAIYSLFIFISGILYYYDKRRISYFVTIVFGLWSLFNSSRNIFLCQSLAVVILFYIDKIHESNFYNKILIYKKKTSQLIIMLLLGFVAIVNIYETMAANGTLGERVYEKYIAQKYSKDGLASGRSDAFQSLYAISLNPLFGYGSYAKDKDGIIREYNIKRNIIVSNKEDEGMLPGHSYILGAWVYAGIFGFIFFAFVLKFILMCISKGVLLYNQQLTGIGMYTLVSMVWNILFSPFADRINFLYFIIFLMILERNFRLAIKLNVKQ